MTGQTAASPKRGIKNFEWANGGIIVAMHVLAVFAFLNKPTWMDLTLFSVCYLLTGTGISLGYHRLLTHKAFECPGFIKAALASLGAASLMGSPVSWVANHRRHHQVSDQPGEDVHSPRDGFLHSHFGWILFKGRKAENRRLAEDLMADRFLKWLDGDVASFVPWAGLTLFCFALGGWTGVLWGAVFRTVLVWHTTWSINSICHCMGRRPFKCPDDAGNVWWLGILGFGEGWHNNHHSHPRSAYLGHSWWQIDIPKYVLLGLETLGLAWSVSRPEQARSGHLAQGG